VAALRISIFARCGVVASPHAANSDWPLGSVPLNVEVAPGWTILDILSAPRCAGLPMQAMALSLRSRWQPVPRLSDDSAVLDDRDDRWDAANGLGVMFMRWVWSMLLLLLLGGGCSNPRPVPLARQVELDRMYGGWYIVATIPNWFEKGLVNPYDVYSPRPDGDIKEEFYLQRGSFAAARTRHEVHDRVQPNSGNARWRVQIFWPLNLPFLVLYVDPQYRYALFGEDSRNLGWIYARSPEISDADYRDLLARFAADGYDTGKFIKFVQKPGDIGKPGYWSDGIVRAEGQK
jgi:apolipoprotein D and lipocalin family protein